MTSLYFLDAKSYAQWVKAEVGHTNVAIILLWRGGFPYNIETTWPCITPFAITIYNYTASLIHQQNIHE